MANSSSRRLACSSATRRDSPKLSGRRGTRSRSVFSTLASAFRSASCGMACPSFLVGCGVIGAVLGRLVFAGLGSAEVDAVMFGELLGIRRDGIRCRFGELPVLGPQVDLQRRQVARLGV